MDDDVCVDDVYGHDIAKIRTYIYILIYQEPERRKGNIVQSAFSRTKQH